MLPGSFNLYWAALLQAVLRRDQEMNLGMFPTDSGMWGRESIIWIGQLCHATTPMGEQTVPWSLCLLAYLQTKYSLRVRRSMWANHQVIWRDYLSVKAPRAWWSWNPWHRPGFAASLSAPLPACLGSLSLSPSLFHSGHWAGG